MINRKYQLEEAVENMVQTFIGRNFDHTPSPAEVLSKLGLSVREASLRYDHDGYFDPSSASVVLNRLITYPPRRNFTLFHEITHKLINDDGELYEDLHELLLLRKTQQESQNYLEYLCNIGAAEFLIPTSEIRADFKINDFSITNFQRLKAKFPASAQAFLIKFARLSPVDCICLSSLYGSSENTSEVQQDRLFQVERRFVNKCFIEFSARSKNFKYSLKKYTAVPDDHLIKYCFDSKLPQNDETYFPFASGKKMPCFAEAFYENRRVFAILYKERPIAGKNQLSLI